MALRPKRRRDKYNPYYIHEENNRYYVTFKDGQGILQNLEISQELFNFLDQSELRDLAYLNEWDRHIEQSEVFESTLTMRAAHKQENMEEEVIRKLSYGELHYAVETLPEKQKRRLMYRFFDEMTYAEIAQKEGCSKRAVEYSVYHAIENLKRFFGKS